MLLVTEAFTEINAGLVICMRSGHPAPLSFGSYDTPDWDVEQAAITVVRAYHDSVKGYLQTTRPPPDPFLALSMEHPGAVVKQKGI